MSAQPEAIRCAEELERSHPMLPAAELRRLHALNEEMLDVMRMGHSDSPGLPAGDLLAAANVLRNHMLDELAERLERKHAAEQDAIAKATGGAA